MHIGDTTYGSIGNTYVVHSFLFLAYCRIMYTYLFIGIGTNYNRINTSYRQLTFIAA